MVKGVDVSHWRGQIDWAQVAQYDIKFAYLKSSGGIRYVDPTYQINKQGCKDNGIIYGPFHFFYPFLGGREQADHFIDTIGDDYQLPPDIDSERAYGESWETVAQRTLECLQETERLASTKPILYSGSWFGSHLGICRDYDLWLAHYEVSLPNIPPGWNDWTFWQYTMRGKVPGVPGYCDLNFWNGTLAELEAYANIKPPDAPYQVELNIPIGVKEIDIRVKLE